MFTNQGISQLWDIHVDIMYLLTQFIIDLKVSFKFYNSALCQTGIRLYQKIHLYLLLL